MGFHIIFDILLEHSNKMPPKHESYSTSRQSYVTVYAEDGVIFKKLQLLFE